MGGDEVAEGLAVGPQGAVAVVQRLGGIAVAVVPNGPTEPRPDGLIEDSGDRAWSEVALADLGRDDFAVSLVLENTDRLLQRLRAREVPVEVDEVERRLVLRVLARGLLVGSDQIGGAVPGFLCAGVGEARIGTGEEVLQDSPPARPAVGLPEGALGVVVGGTLALVVSQPLPGDQRWRTLRWKALNSASVRGGTDGGAGTPAG
ncbi:hypothetical protein BH10ACT11_BH10ACT11_10440 [soil metagenome]